MESNLCNWALINEPKLTTLSRYTLTCMHLPRQPHEIMHLNLDLLTIPAKRDFKSQQRQKYAQRLFISRTSLQVLVLVCRHACVPASLFVCVRLRHAKRYSSPKATRVAAGGEYLILLPRFHMSTSTLGARPQVCQNSEPEMHSCYCMSNTRAHAQTDTHRQTQTQTDTHTDTRLLNSQENSVFKDIRTFWGTTKTNHGFLEKI